jgi:hypothetical protein
MSPDLASLDHLPAPFVDFYYARKVSERTFDDIYRPVV